VAVLVGSDHVPAPRPEGRAVEAIGGFRFDHPDHYFAKSHVFTPARFPDRSTISVYEGLTPLFDTDFIVNDAAYIVRFKASDGSDPRENGRRYWVVAR
jgi:hypothetical protein